MDGLEAKDTGLAEEGSMAEDTGLAEEGSMAKDFGLADRRRVRRFNVEDAEERRSCGTFVLEQLKPGSASEEGLAEGKQAAAKLENAHKQRDGHGLKQGARAGRENQRDEEEIETEERGKGVKNAGRTGPGSAADGVELEANRHTDGNTEMKNKERDVNGFKHSTRGGREYLKEATMIVNVEDVNGVSVSDIIKAVSEKCGHGKILVLRLRQGKEYELTMDKVDTCDKLMEGLTIKGVDCEVKSLVNREYVVSFMHLPGYLPDTDIINKLVGWGVNPISHIRRRFYPNTDIEDGTRFLKVRFPKEVTSLPYSTRFDTEEGPKYYRVMHSRQVKTCRLCMSPEHLFRDCPEFQCHKCKQKGHYARECQTRKCTNCKNYENNCECIMEVYDSMFEEEGERDAGAEGKEVGGGREEGGEGRERVNELNDREAELKVKGSGLDNINKDTNEGGGSDEEEERMEEGPQEGKMGEDSCHRGRGEEENVDTVNKASTEMGQSQTDTEMGDCSHGLGEEDKGGGVEGAKGRAGQTRRRTTKVLPNLEAVRKKVRKKTINRYDVLRTMEEEKGEEDGRDVLD